MIRVPATNGTIEVEESAGRCVVNDCAIKGGGLVRIRHVGVPSEDATWDGKAIVLCGEHFRGALATVFLLPPDDA